jgi:hypothetical protein
MAGITEGTALPASSCVVGGHAPPLDARSKVREVAKWKNYDEAGPSRASTDGQYIRVRCLNFIKFKFESLLYKTSQYSYKFRFLNIIYI